MIMALTDICTGDACGGTTGGLAAGLPFWGGVSTSSYKILFTLHILAVVSAFGPTLLYPMITRVARAHTGDTAQAIARIPFNLNKRLFLPSLLAAAIFGILLTADSSKVYDMSKPWISGAFAVVIALGLISWFILRPAQGRMVEGLANGADGEKQVRAARANIAAATGIYHLGLIVVVVLMVWKPGQ